MRPQGDSIHVTAQLVLAVSDQTTWAGSFEGSRNELLRMQHDIARNVVEQVRARMSADERAALGGGRAVAPEAFDRYVRGRFWWNRRNRENLLKAIAAPHATLGYAAMYYDWDWRTAEREYRLAIARNPSYATAHEWYGLFQAAMGRFDEAQAEERRALEMDPLSIAIAGTSGWVLHYSGKQQQAEAVLRTALRMDSTFAIGHLYLGRVLQLHGQTDI